MYLFFVVRTHNSNKALHGVCSSVNSCDDGGGEISVENVYYGQQQHYGSRGKYRGRPYQSRGHRGYNQNRSERNNWRDTDKHIRFGNCHHCKISFCQGLSRY